MPHIKLTAKQEVFCQGIANGLGQADAYRHAYDAEGMKDNVIYSKASTLMTNGKVTERIAELRSQIEQKQLWSREMSVKGLIEAYRTAREAKQSSGMTQAVRELNAMHGYNEPTKFNIAVRNLTPIEDEDWL